MNTRLALVILLLIVTCSTATVPQGNPTVSQGKLPQGNLNDEQIIKNRLTAYAATLKQGNGVATAAFYTTDGEERSWCGASIKQG